LFSSRSHRTIPRSKAGATFTQNDSTHWQVNFNGGASHEIITFSNAASIHASDVLFL